MPTVSFEADLDAKVGQLMMVGFDGEALSDDVARYLRARRFGSIVLFARNLRDPAQISTLTSQLRRLANGAGGGDDDSDGDGLLVAVDQEGGVVTRLTTGVTVFPGNMALGATEEPDLAFRAAKVMGAEMRALGLNVNLAPVLDVNNNPHNPGIGVRSYGESAEVAAEMGAAAIRGYHEAGVAATAKHFPGKGDCTVDSHLDLPTIPHGRARPDEVELVPFRRAIAEGVDMIMTAHVNFPAYDESGIPATLSRSVLTGLLRDRLGYSGVIVTDDLLMGGITRRFTVGEAAVRAFEAGADLLVVAHPGESQDEVWRALRDAIGSGRIPTARVEESLARIRALKRKLTLGLPVDLPVDPSAAPEALPGATESLRLAPDARIAVVSPEVKSLTMVEDSESAHNPLAREVAVRWANVAGVEVGESPEPREIEEAAAKAAACDVIIAATYNAHLHPGQAELVRRLAGLGKPVVACALRNPYDVAMVPEAQAFLTNYGFRDCNLKALAEVIFGERPPLGRSPVTIPGVCSAGHGVFWTK